MRAIAITLFFAMAGCQSNADQPAVNANQTTHNTTAATHGATHNATTQTTQTNLTTASACESAGVVSFATSDDVTLAADFQPADGAGRGAVVLFHMIPPGNDRTSYPPRVRDALHALNLNVLNVDRRGAGESGGVARDAYEGTKTSLDVEAAVTFLQSTERTCAVDMTKLMLVGASNGTTSVFDYAVARTDASLPAPTAMVWMSPGTYTEAQNKVADHREQLDVLPLLIIHPDGEPWAAQFNTGKPAAWKIVEIADGQHGTRNFDNGALEAIALPPLVEWASAL